MGPKVVRSSAKKSMLLVCYNFLPVCDITVPKSLYNTFEMNKSSGIGDSKCA